MTKAKKPWSYQRCRDTYVYGDMDLRTLAKQAGIAEGTVFGWSASDPEGKWSKQREAYRSKLKEATDEKTIEKTSEALSDRFSEIAIANYKIQEEVRDYAGSLMRLKRKFLDDLLEKNPDPDDLRTALREHNAHEINFLSLVITRAIESIAASTGLTYYTNVNQAARVLEREGYVILDPTQKDDDLDQEDEDTIEEFTDEDE